MTYTPELGEAVLEAIETRPYGLRQICAELSEELGIKLHARDIMRWKNADDPQDYVPGFKERYLEAKRAQNELSFDNLRKEASTERRDQSGRDNVERSKLIVHTEMWALVKRDPDAYGDKQKVEHSGEGGGPVRFVLERIGAKKESNGQ